MNNPYEKPYFEPLTSPIHPSVKFGKNVHVGHYVVIEERCEIGDNTIIESLVFIRANIKIGNGCIVRSGSMVTRNIPDRMIATGNPVRYG